MKKNFNLVEIILAMGIIVICITSVLGMFAGGVKMSKNAAAFNYASQIAEQFAGYAQNNASFTSTLPTTKPAASNATYEDAEDGCSSVLDSGDDFLAKVKGNSSTSGLYKVEYNTSIASATATDFIAIARVWKTSTTLDTSNGSISATVVNIEITWTATDKYENRAARGNRFAIQRVLVQ